eukprot:5430953-Amphidinium_carterae.1
MLAILATILTRPERGERGLILIVVYETNDIMGGMHNGATQVVASSATNSHEDNWGHNTEAVNVPHPLELMKPIINPVRRGPASVSGVRGWRAVRLQPIFLGQGVIAAL